MNVKAKEITGEVIEHEPARGKAVAQQQPQAVSTDQPGMSLVERAAKDPNVDIDKLERLVLMQERAVAAQKDEAFREALSAAQSEMTPIATDSQNPSTRSKYASYAALDRALRPIYTKHGFALSFNTEPGAPEGSVRVVCWVSCKGHKEKYEVDMPNDGKGAKGNDVMTRTHAQGSAMTYGQRYLLKMIFNIAVGADDDGNRAGKKQGAEVSDQDADKMRDTIRALISEMKMDIDKFLKWAKAPSVEDIPGAELKDIVASLEERKRKLGEKK